MTEEEEKTERLEMRKNLLLRYVSDDDITLDLDMFLKTVAERILDDLGS
jgi:hypothetical protein